MLNLKLKILYISLQKNTDLCPGQRQINTFFHQEQIIFLRDLRKGRKFLISSIITPLIFFCPWGKRARAEYLIITKERLVLVPAPYDFVFNQGQKHTISNIILDICPAHIFHGWKRLWLNIRVINHTNRYINAAITLAPFSLRKYAITLFNIHSTLILKFIYLYIIYTIYTLYVYCASEFIILNST